MNYIKDEIKGENDNKILIICGTHGNESNAVQVVNKIRLYFKENIPKNTLKFVIGWNETGLMCDTREYQDMSPSETKDLNRCFESKKYPSVNELVDVLKKEIDECKYVIDVHNSPNCLDITILDDVPNSYQIGLNLLVNGLDPQSISIRIGNNNANTIKKYVNSLDDKLGFTVEFGGMGICSNDRLEEEKRWLLKFINAVSKLNPLNYNNTAYLTIANDFVAKDIYSHCDGIIHYCDTNNPMKFYCKGENIGTIRNYDDEILEVIVAPCDGYLITIDDTFICTNSCVIGEFQPKLEVIE